MIPFVAEIHRGRDAHGDSAEVLYLSGHFNRATGRATVNQKSDITEHEMTELELILQHDAKHGPKGLLAVFWTP